MKQQYSIARFVLVVCMWLQTSLSMDMQKTGYNVNNDTTENDCGVCLENLQQPGHDVIVLGCKNNPGKHAFHFACLLEWQKKHTTIMNTTCPLCRDHIAISEEPEHRVFATLQLMTEETTTLKEAHECTEGCFKAFKLLDAFMAMCPCTNPRN